MDNIFNTDQARFSEVLFDDFIGSKRDSLGFNFSITSLVDQIRNSLSGRISESDVSFDFLQHIHGSSVNSDERSIVDLSQSEQSQDLSNLRSKILDTSDSDDKDSLDIGRNVEGIFSSGSSLNVNERLLLLFVFLDVLFNSLDRFVLLVSGSRNFVLSIQSSLFGSLDISVSSSKDSFRDELRFSGGCSFRFHFLWAKIIL